MSSPSPVETLRVLTVNTHKGFTFFNRRFILPELRDAVRAVSADVVFLQEVLGAHRGHARRFRNWPEVPQYEFLADTIWTDFAYGRNAVYPDGDHGNALLSKFPIRCFHNLDVSVSSSERRGLLHCELEVPGHPAFHVVCVHLGLREGHRQRQIALLRELLAGLPRSAPLVVAGDFNDWRLRAGRALGQGAGLNEVFEEAHGQVAKTFPALWPVLPLDRIYLRNAVAHHPQVLIQRPWPHLSDHLPLFTEVRV